MGSDRHRVTRAIFRKLRSIDPDQSHGVPTVLPAAIAEEVRAVAFEFPTPAGVLRLLRQGCRWAVEFNGHRHGQWPTADAAALAAVRHRTGVPDWDRSRLVVSDDLLRWRPLGDSL